MKPRWGRASERTALLSTPLAPGEVLLKSGEVAQLLRCSEQTARNLTLHDGLRFVRLGRALRFRKA